MKRYSLPFEPYPFSASKADKSDDHGVLELSHKETVEHFVRIGDLPEDGLIPAIAVANLTASPFLSEALDPCY